MNKNEEEITKNYYASQDIQDFYRNVWGGENIHIGMYPVEHATVTPNYILEASNRKIDLLISLLNKFTSFHSGNLTIADFGSGYGGTLRYISDKCKKSKMDSYELSPENCEVNTNKNTEGNYNITVLNQSFLDTQKPKNTYDVIISEDAFIHINDKSELFMEISRVLKPGGFLIFSDIIMTHKENNRKEEKDICERIGIERMETLMSYNTLARENNLTYCDSILYKLDALRHYENIRTLATKYSPTIINGLNLWIKNIKENNLTAGIIIYKKNN
jgi:2-polyprenyl-3-methyl-5-hydroxy-6-metoxy-1,4-benzoquinol methylase